MFPIQKKPELFFKPKESPTFAAAFRKAQALGVKLMPAKIDGGNAAMYDPVKNVIYISGKDFKHPTGSTRRSTAHELYHALQSESVLRKGNTNQQREKLIEQHILSMSERDYIDYAWKKELAAEKFAWQCDVEATQHFSKATRGAGFPNNFLKQVVQTRLNEYSKSQKSKYIKAARSRWQKVHRKYGKKAPASSQPK